MSSRKFSNDESHLSHTETPRLAYFPYGRQRWRIERQEM
jgi:hypothetical protein